MIIQVVLIAGLVVCLLAIAFSERRRSRFVSVSVSLVAIAGIYVVLNPESSNRLAHFVGLSRGADLILYCWLVISLAVSVSLQLKILGLQQLLTELAQEMTLQAARGNSGNRVNLPRHIVEAERQGSAGVSPHPFGHSGMSSSELRCVLPGCDGRTIALYRLKRFAVEEIPTAGMRFRRPLPTADELQRMYEDPVYHASAYFSAQYGQNPRRSSPEVRIHADALRWLGGRPDIPAPSARTLLDVGCGTGLFLGMALHHGWRAVGVELLFLARCACSEGAAVGRAVWRFSRRSTAGRELRRHHDVGLSRARSRSCPGGREGAGSAEASGRTSSSLRSTLQAFSTRFHLTHRLFGQRAQQPLELLYDARHKPPLHPGQPRRVTRRPGPPR